MNKIIWLSSYPKSGNTWMRTFLSHISQQNNEQPFTFNQLEKNGIYSSRELFDEVLGIDSADLDFDEIDRLRPLAESFRLQQEQIDIFSQFRKIHDAYTVMDHGAPLVPEDVTYGAIYLLRNPLDICVSLAHHSGHKDLDKTVAFMENQESGFCTNRNKQSHQLRQQLRSWSEHVLSWTQELPFPVLVIRYEDMHLSPVETFTKVLQFSGLEFQPEQIAHSIEMTSFDHLKQLEQVSGFSEKPAKADQFFRKGKIGDWRNHLSTTQAERIIEQHHSVMADNGYLDAQDKPIY